MVLLTTSGLNFFSILFLWYSIHILCTRRSEKMSKIVFLMPFKFKKCNFYGSFPVLKSPFWKYVDRIWVTSLENLKTIRQALKDTEKYTIILCVWLIWATRQSPKKKIKILNFRSCDYQTDGHMTTESMPFCREFIFWKSRQIASKSLCGLKSYTHL